MWVGFDGAIIMWVRVTIRGKFGKKTPCWVKCSKMPEMKGNVRTREAKNDEKWGGQFGSEKAQRQWFGKHTDNKKESEASKSLRATGLNVYLVNGRMKPTPLYICKHFLHLSLPIPCLCIRECHVKRLLLCMCYDNKVSEFLWDIYALLEAAHRITSSDKENTAMWGRK